MIKSASYKNFYESLKEANMRLNGTVVLYDGDPYYVLCITDHMKDGEFRVYLDPVSDQMAVNRFSDLPSNIPEGHFLGLGTNRGAEMDKWMEAHKDSGVIRKNLSSKKFNSFRSFPLGMMEYGRSYCMYVERHPTRNPQQGLQGNSLIAKQVLLENSHTCDVNMFTDFFKACVRGEYDTLNEAYEKLKDPNTGKKSVPFHRRFALVKGVLGQTILWYKNDPVGFVKKDKAVGGFSVSLDKQFVFVKESVDELGLFFSVEIHDY